MGKKTKNTYRAAGQMFDIADKDTSEFLSDFPKAEKVESYVAGKDTFDIAEGDVSEFMVDFPNAVKKKGETTASTDGAEDVSIPPSPSPSTETITADLPGSSYEQGGEYVTTLGDLLKGYNATPNDLGFTPAIDPSLPLTEEESDQYSEILQNNRNVGSIPVFDDASADYNLDSMLSTHSRQRELLKMDEGDKKREYLASRVLDESVVGKLVKPVIGKIVGLSKGERLELDRLAGMVGDQEVDPETGEVVAAPHAYDPNKVQKVAAGLMTIMADMPTVFGPLGGLMKLPAAAVGRLVAGGVSWMGATRAVVGAMQNMISASVQMAGTLGGHSWVNALTEKTVNQGKALNELDKKDWKEIHQAGGQSAAVGAAVGPIGAGTRILASSEAGLPSMINNAVGKAALKAGVNTVGLGVEAGTFSYGSALAAREEEWMKKGKEGYLESLMTIGGLKGMHIPSKVPMKVRDVDVRSKTELDALAKHTDLSLSYEETIKDVVLDPKKVEAIINDPAVPWEAKAEIMNQHNGLNPEVWAPVMRGVDMVEGVDGRFTVTTRSSDGAPISMKEFPTKAAAMKQVMEAETVARENNAATNFFGMEPKDMMAVDDALKDLGYDNGYENQGLSEAISTPANLRTKRQNAIVGDWLDIVEETGRVAKEKTADKPTEKAPTAPVEDVQASSEGKVPPEAEKPSEGVKKPQEEVQERRVEKEQKRLDALDAMEKESTDLGEAYRALKKRAVEERMTTSPDELDLLKFIESDPTLKGAVDNPDVKFEISSLREEVQGKKKAVGEGLAKIQKEDPTPVKKVETIIESTKVEKQEKVEEVVVKEQEPVKEEVKPKAEKPKAKSVTEESEDYTGNMAMTVDKGEFVLSEEPLSKKTQNKIDRLKKRYEEAKSEPKRQRELIDGFIKANSAQLTEAGITAADLRKLNNVKTWNGVAKLIKKYTGRIGEPTTKQRAAAMEDYIRENVKSFEGVSSRLHNALLKKVAKAGQSNEKLKAAKEYMEKILNNAEYRREENKRIKAIDDIKIESAQKKILERKGKRARAKKAYLSRTGKVDDIDAYMEEVNELAEKGSSKRYPNPLEKIDQNSEELRRLAEKEPLSDADRDLIDDLVVENSFLEYGILETLPADRVEQKLKALKGVRELQRDVVAEERAENRKRLEDNKESGLEIISGGKGPQSSLLGQKKKPRKRTNKKAMYIEKTWSSLMSELARLDYRQAGDPLPLYPDRMNEMHTRRVLNSTKRQEKLNVAHHKERNDAFEEAYGLRLTTNAKTMDVNAKLKLNELSTEAPTDVEIYNEDGTVHGKLTLSQFTAAEKWLQLRDPDGAEGMFKPADKGGNGFTEETVKQLEDYLTPETKKFFEWAYGNLPKYSKIYDEAYRKENGVSMLNSNPGYWVLTKPKVRAPLSRGEADIGGSSTAQKQPRGKPQRGMEDPYTQSSISQDRTVRRTGDKTALEYTSAFETYDSYVNEAVQYSSWAETSRELSYFFKDPQIRETIKLHHGTKAMNLADDYITDFQGNLERTTIELVDKAVDRVLGGVLGLKVRPAVKQALSSIYYGFDMPSRRLVQNTANMIAGTSPKWRSMKELVKMQSFLENRNAQSIATGQDMAIPAMEMQRLGANPKKEKLLAYANAPLDRAQKISGAPLRAGDKLPIVNAGGAYIDSKYQDYSGKKLTDKVLRDAINGEVDPHLAKAIEDWDVVSMLSQQSQRKMNVSMIRKRHSVLRAATSLTSGPMQIHRLAYNFAREAKKQTKAGNVKLAAKYTGQAFVAHSVSGVLFQLAQQNFNLGIIREKSDKDKVRLGASAILGNLEAIALIGKPIAWLKAKISDEWYADDGIAGTQVVETASDVSAAAWDMLSEATADVPDWGKFKRHGKRFLVHSSKFAGQPIDGAENIIEGWAQILSGESREVIADALGMGRYDESMAAWKQDGYSYSSAVDEMERKMAFDEEDNFVAAYDKISKYAEVLHERGIDPVSVLRTAYMGEVRDRFREKYGDPSTLKQVDKIFAESGGQLSEGDVDRLETLYTKFEEKTGDLEVMENVREEFENIIDRSEIGSLGGYKPAKKKVSPQGKEK